MSLKTVLQITGEPNAGKSELCKWLEKEKGFTPVLVSDLIRDYARPRGIELRERRDFIDAHTRMLSELGKFAISEAILNTPSSRISVDGIRVPAHVERLRQYGLVIALRCPPEIRFQRSLERRSPLDKTTYEEFIADEMEEARNEDPYVQSTLTVMDSADYNVDSSRPFNEVVQEVDKIIAPYIK